MSPRNIIKLNKRILNVYNSCDREVFSALLQEILDYPTDVILKIFTRKIFLWNIIRPRDFYKLIAYFIVDNLAHSYYMDRVEFLVHVILTTTPDEKIRRTFVWSILKHCPLLTIDTIAYASAEKIRSILQSDKEIITDAAITPFITELKRLRDENCAYRTIVDN